MSFTPFSNLTFPTIPTISNPFVSKQKDNGTFEIVKYLNENEMFSYDTDNYRDYTYTINIGYITTKYLPTIKDTGCYMIMVESQIGEGPNAIFCLARSDKSKAGTIQTLVSSNGKSNDRLDMKWNPMEYPCILLKHNFNRKQILKDDTKLRFGYNIRIIYI